MAEVPLGALRPAPPSAPWRTIAAGAAVLLVAAVCIRLGVWQLDRHAQRETRNAALTEALTLPPLHLTGDTLRAVASNPERYLYRRAVAAGSYLAEAEVVLRGRASAGRPGVHLVTPLQVEGRLLLVNRGWAPSADAGTVDPRPYAEPGRRLVQGILQPLPPPGADAREALLEIDGLRVRTAQRIDPAAVAAATGRTVIPVYLQQLPTAAETPALERIPLPELGAGPHLGYAFQWFSFAAIALLGLGLLAYLSRRSATRG